jgi:hypothetical protein
MKSFPNRDAKPFSLWSIPHFPKSASEVISDPGNLHENMIDILGCELFQRRDDILAYIRLLVEDDQFRSKLGTIKRRPYDALANLNDVEKEIALTIAQNAMDCLIEQISGMLCDAPSWYEEGYAIQYKLEGRILSFDGKKYKTIARHQLGGGSQGILAKSFGRWLNIFRK